MTYKELVVRVRTNTITDKEVINKLINDSITISCENFFSNEARFSITMVPEIKRCLPCANEYDFETFGKLAITLQKAYKNEFYDLKGNQKECIDNSSIEYQNVRECMNRFVSMFIGMYK